MDCALLQERAPLAVCASTLARRAMLDAVRCPNWECGVTVLPWWWWWWWWWCTELCPCQRYVLRKPLVVTPWTLPTDVYKFRFEVDLAPTYIYRLTPAFDEEDVRKGAQWSRSCYALCGCASRSDLPSANTMLRVQRCSCVAPTTRHGACRVRSSILAGVRHSHPRCLFCR